MQIALVIILLLAVSFEIVPKVYTESEFQDRENALEFLTEKREFDLIKRFMYTGKEQRREAKEKYEEKCERKLNSIRKKPRWCPELTSWDEWQKVTAKDGIKNKSG